MKTASGLINQKIEIYRDEDIRNSSAGVIPNSVLYWATNASVEPLKAPRDTGQSSEIFKPSYRFILNDRVDKEVRPNMLIKYRDAWFTITECIPDYVYVGSLMLTAITSDIPQRQLGPVEHLAYWWVSDVNEALTEADILQTNSFSFVAGGQIILPWRTLGEYKFVNVAVPIEEPIKTNYENEDNPTDSGEIGGDDNLLNYAIETGVFNQYNGNYPVIIDSNFILTTQ